jgi:hypothetical protein
MRASEQEREEGRIWPLYAHTMIGKKRLDNLQHCLETVLRGRVPGDLIEAGVWRGGACILMQALLTLHGETARRLFVADSFRGLPRPDPAYPQDRDDPHHRFTPVLGVSRAEVRGNFEKFGLLGENLVFLEGWFRDTLPALPTDTLALIRIDGDMYGSTMDVLVNLYPRLSRGGYVIVDDHSLEGCRQAVADYRRRMGIVDPIQTVDWTGIFWEKTHDV